MAKTIGPIQFEGNVGQHNFFKRDGEFNVRMKGGLSAERIKNDPGLWRIRAQGVEFGRAGIASKSLRKAFLHLTKPVDDGKASNRLLRKMTEVVKADATHVRGERIILGANLPLMKGFQFNSVAPFSNVVVAPLTATIARDTGQCTVNLASFVPKDSVFAPDETTHFKIVAAAAAIDFGSDTEPDPVLVQSTAELPWDKNPTAAINLVSPVAANSPLPIFLAVGITFHESRAGISLALPYQFNALQLVQVSVV